MMHSSLDAPLEKEKEFFYSSFFLDQLHKIQDEEGIEWKRCLILDSG